MEGPPNMEGQQGKDTAKYLRQGRNRLRWDRVRANLPPSNPSYHSVMKSRRLLQRQNPRDEYAERSDEETFGQEDRIRRPCS